MLKDKNYKIKYNYDKHWKDTNINVQYDTKP